MMEKFINDAAELFGLFLTEKELTFKNHSSDSLLVSFIIDADNFGIEDKIDGFLKNNNRSFYFEQPDKSFRVFASGDVLDITESGDGRFAITDKKLKGWKERIVSNREKFEDINIPVFVGGMKFTAEHPDNEWKDFQDSTWFVPSFMFVTGASENLLVLNFLHNPKKKPAGLAARFHTILESISRIQPDQPEPLPRLKITGGASPKDRKKWMQMVTAGLERINDDSVQKIVLARKTEMQLSHEPSFERIIESLKNEYPGCSIFLFRQKESTFFGASPETLGNFKGEIVHFDALAGSAPRGKDETEDKEFEKNLLASSKDVVEHNFVVDYIKDSLSGVSGGVEINNRLSIRKLSNIQHIHTDISAKLGENTSMFNILDQIYPTPAICGLPKSNALQAIKKLEIFDRGMYSGIIGMFNFENEGNFIVALRSALCRGTKLYAYAGSGIVNDSDPVSEFSETELKLKPVMTLFKHEN